MRMQRWGTYARLQNHGVGDFDVDHLRTERRVSQRRGCSNLLKALALPFHVSRFTFMPSLRYFDQVSCANVDA